MNNTEEKPTLGTNITLDYKDLKSMLMTAYGQGILSELPEGKIIPLEVIEERATKWHKKEHQL